MLISYFTLLAVLATGCLAMNTRVLNGEPAEPHQFPYHVGIYQKLLEEPISKLRYRFGGAVISDRWVLTTAYSKYLTSTYSHVFVKAGKHNVDEEEADEQVRFVVRYIIHPEYQIYSERNPISRNDIALLRVDAPFKFNEYVRAAGIASASAYFASGSLAGWGSTGVESYVPNYPKELHYNSWLPVIDTQTCADAINKVASTNGFSPVEINSNQTCSINGISGGCYKDDGNAFVSRVDDRYVVFGIVATINLPCGNVKRPTVYTRVGAYADWINEVVKSS